MAFDSVGGLVRKRLNQKIPQKILVNHFTSGQSARSFAAGFA
jgi:hypothetical protein